MAERISPLRRPYMGGAAIVGWGGLVLQLVLSINLTLERGGTAMAGVVRYLTYFTILTNLIVAIALTWPLLAPSSNAGRFLARADTVAAITSYIIIVGIIYNLLLRQGWSPTGWARLADEILHDVMPIAFTLYWLIFVPKGRIRWGRPMAWLIYPLCYYAYVLVMGVFTSFYPYPFVDVNTLGYARACTNGLYVLFGFLIIGLVLVTIDRLFGPAQIKNHPAGAE